MNNISYGKVFRKTCIIFVAVCLGMSFSSCAPIPTESVVQTSPSAEQTVIVSGSSTQNPARTISPSAVQTDQYVIQAGDELEIDFYGDYNLDQKMDVRPDGFLSMPLIGDIKADGLTVPELISELEKKYSRELNDPRINVIVRRFSSNVVFIGGDVKEPSGIHFDGKITVLQAIALAGGYNPKTAIINKVLVIRRQPGKPPQRYIVDLSKIIDGSDIGQDFYLYQYDTVYVPAKE